MTLIGRFFTTAAVVYSCNAELTSKELPPNCKGPTKVDPMSLKEKVKLPQYGDLLICPMKLQKHLYVF